MPRGQIRVVCTTLVLASLVAAQEPARPRIGLVLSGGGARGMAHVGVLEVLEELRVPIHCIAGTSMGSVVGGMYAYGHSPAELERGLVRKDFRRDWKYLMQDQPDRRDLRYRRREDDTDFLVDLDIGIRDWRLVLPKGLSQGQNLDLELRFQALDAHRLASFDDLPIPFRTTATDLTTGKSVVLDAGSLPAAMRASMSVPGMFAPVRIDGREFVDGGIVKNLPVDLARQMGADVLIVVDIGSPLLETEQIASLLGVTEQVFGILVQQNIDRAIATLEDDDVLIQPNLGGLGTTDFEEGARAIALGRRGALEMAEQLRRFSVTPAEYESFLRNQRRAPAELPVITRIEIENGSTFADEYLRARMRTQAGERLSTHQLRRDLEWLFGVGDFERVSFELIRERPGEAMLRILVEQKSWGPNYIDFGLQMADDFRGNTAYLIGMRSTLRQLNAWGGEWRNTVTLGDLREFASEFYQPIEPTGRLFVAPRARALRFPLRIFDTNGQLVSDVEASGVELGVDVGTVLGRLGEMRIGIERLFAEGDVELSSISGGDIDFDDARFRVRVDIDTMDAPLFARNGHFFRSEWSLGSRDFGGDDDYQTLQVSTGGARGTDAFGSTLFARYETALEGAFPPSTRPTIGGLFQVSGLERGEVSGNHVVTLGLAGYYQINQSRPGPFDLPVYVGATMEVGNATDVESQLFSDLILAGSVSFGLDTLLGPVLVGYGYAEGGRDSVHLTVGFTF